MIEAILGGALLIEGAALVVCIRALSAAGHRATLQSVARDAAEAQRYALLDKATRIPRRVKAAKSEPIHPHGL